MDAGPVTVSGSSGHGHTVSPGPVAARAGPVAASGTYTVFARATRCGPLSTAVSPSTPLARSALALVIRVQR